MDSSQLSKGAILQGGKYRIESVLGQGGFGITYLATQELLDRKVAVKEFFMRDFCSREGDTSSVTLGTASNRETMERYLNKFLKEARTIAALTHPNIIQIHDMFKENNTAYYVMEYIEGESLSQLIKCRGALSESEAVKYIRSVAEALKYVHERKINHLDVKPGNIMLRHADNRVFLLDFGLSKQYDAEGNQTSSTPVGISHGYAPIEQYKPGGVKEFSPQTDIYALGATLYYLVTGIVPPSATELFDTELAYPETLSASICNAIGTAMKPRKVERPKDVDAFLVLLASEQLVSNVNLKKENTEDENHLSNKKPEIENEELIKLIKVAEQGDTDAQNDLGDKYYYGQGIDQNYPEAVKWYRKAAEQGNSDAQYNLGYMYQYGKGVIQNYSKAINWYRKATEQGDEDAKKALRGLESAE